MVFPNKFNLNATRIKSLLCQKGFVLSQCVFLAGLSQPHIAFSVQATCVDPANTSNTVGSPSGRNAIACGYNTSTSGSQAIAVGANAAAASQSVVVGNDTRAEGVGSIAVGSDDSGESGDGGYSDLPALNDKGVVRAITNGDHRQTITYGIASTAVGAHAQALSKGSVAIGVGATSGDGGVSDTTWNATRANSNTEAIAIGALSHAQSERSIALGAGAQALAEHAFAAGFEAQATQAKSVAIGFDARATGEDAYALGYKSRARGENSIALGTGSAAGASTGNATSKQETIAIGNNTQAYAAQAIAMGSDIRASGDYGIAIGSNTQTRSVVSAGYAGVAIGSGGGNQGATANGESAVAIGGGNEDANGLDGANATAKNAVAIGSGSSSTQQDAVALGSQSLANTTASVQGYDPLGRTTAPTGREWVSTLGAVSVGNANNTRQITNVAAGTQATDAVNVAQLKAVKTLATSDLTFAADSGTAVTRKLGQTLSIKGGETDSNKLSDDNIGVVADGAGTLNVKLAKELKGLTSVQTGNALLNTNGLTITGGPSVLISGINAGSKKIINVANGTNANDAVNYSQLQAVSNTASAGFSLAGNSEATGTTDKLIKPNDTLSVVGASANTNFTQSDGGKNIYTQISDNQVTIGLANNLNVTSITTGDASMNTNGLTITGGPSVVKSGIHAGNQNITNVKSGLNGKTLSTIQSTDAEWSNAATVGDLTQVASNVSNVNSVVVGTNTNQQSITESLNTYNVSGQTVTTNNTVISAIKNMNESGIKFFHTNDGTNTSTGSGSTDDSSASGKFSTAIGYQASATSESALALGNGAQATGVNSISIGTGNVVSGNNSGALGDPSTVTGTGSYVVGNNNTVAADNAFVIGNDVTVSAGNDGAVVLGNQSTVESVHTGNYTVSGQRNTQVAGQTGATTQVVSVGRVGSERQIQNVAPGVISADSTDAINGSQLYHSIEELNTNVGNVYQTVGRIEKNANAGVASAIAVANLPQPHDPGASMTSVAVGHYMDESALSLGLSTISDNGQWVLKGSFTQDTQDNRSYGAGVGFQW